MVSESEAIIAFLFKRSGKEKMSFSDLYLTLSMELNWCPPEAAKTFVDTAVKQKLLSKNDEIVKPNFDIDKISVPLGFRPSKKIFEEKEITKLDKEKDIAKTLLRRIAENTGLDEKKIINEVKEIEREKNITFEVAALLVGKNHDVLLGTFYDIIEEKLRENRE